MSFGTAGPAPPKSTGLPKEYEALLPPYLENMRQNRCIITEWIQDDLPLEDKDGISLISDCQLKYNAKHAGPSPTWSYLEKASDQKAPQCTAGPPPQKENVLVFEDSRGYTKTILQHAPEGRVGVKTIMAGPWSQYTEDDIKEKLATKNLTMVIFGASLDTPKSNDVSDIIEFQEVVVRILFWIAKAIPDFEVPKLCVLTRGMFTEEAKLHEQVGLSLVMFSTMFGFCNTARQELSETTAVQLIDTEYFLDPPSWDYQDSSIRERLASEVWRNQTFGRNTVRILNSGRYVARLAWATPYAEAAGVEFQLPDAGHLICISGGNGALGLVMGKWLLDEAEKNGRSGFEIRFLSRSAKISDTNMPNWKTVEKLAAKLGVTATQMKADLSTKEAIDDFVTGTNGKLFGFIHSAGVLADCMIMNLTWEKFETVWNPKHRAAYYLHDALERIPNQLSFFWLFSSMAVLGNMGQLNYSCSNAGLDGLVRYRRAMGLPGMTFQWGGWGEVGMATTMDEGSRRRMAMGPFPSFSTADGLRGMEEGLKCNVPTCAVFECNPEICIQMQFGRGNTQQEHDSNRNCEIMTLVPLSSNDDSVADFVHQHLQWPLFRNPNRKHLIWDAYVKPLADEGYDTGPALGASIRTLTRKKQ